MADGDAEEKAIERYGRALDRFERAGGYAFEHRIEQVLSGLGFSSEDMQRPMGQMSGGQKTRALLGRLLLQEPDLLLLDEPTNHLDLAGVEWLEGYLSSWKGSLVVVAHDRAFLDATVDWVWELARGRLETYRGGYSDYVQQRAERVARQRALYDRQQEAIAETEEFIRRNIAGQKSTLAKSRRKSLERLDRVERPQEYDPIKFALEDPSRTGDLVLGLHDLQVGYEPETCLVEIGDLELRRGDHVALLGPNGCGKTSLLRTILAEIPPLSGRVRIGAGVKVGYFAQGHTNLDPEKAVVDTIVDAGELRISEARNLLGSYRFSGDDVFKTVGALSGGEQARVALAVLVLQGANVLVLDEPTNHLDIPTQEVLEEVLTDFGGTVLMVSHDRYLIRRLASEVWAVADRRLVTFHDYDAYHHWLEERRDGRGSAEPTERVVGRGARERRRRRERERAAQRERQRRAERQEALERKIQDLEDRQANLERELTAASEAQEVARVRELGAEYSAVEAELDKSLAEWASLA
jgi:ATP-binding cassette subfamily F protein 3